jgi:hypothetical protein
MSVRTWTRPCMTWGLIRAQMYETCFKIPQPRVLLPILNVRFAATHPR